MAYKPNAANSTPAALKAAAIHAAVHGVALQIATKQAPVSTKGHLDLPTNQQSAFNADFYQNYSKADKAHNKMAEAFLAHYTNVMDDAE